MLSGVMRKHGKIREIDSIPALEALIREFRESGILYLFRGVSQVYDEVSSSLYRLTKKRGDLTFHGSLDESFVKKVRQYFSSDIPTLGILSDLQHCYLCKLNMIDFTINLYVALYFACEIDNDKPGELLYFNPYKKDKRVGVIYDMNLINTRDSRERVIAQSSFLIRPPSGKIKKCFFNRISIPATFKHEIMRYLREEKNIHDDTVMVDLYCFKKNLIIDNEVREISTTIDEYCKLDSNSASSCKNNGLIEHNEGNYENALRYFDRSIEINPKSASAFAIRSTTKIDLARKEMSNLIMFLDPSMESIRASYQSAIDDLRQSIVNATISDFIYAKPYLNLGLIEAMLGERDKAIAFYNRAIEYRDDYIDAYRNRGGTKRIQGRYEEAIKDFSKAIELDQYDADNWYCRGNAKYGAKLYKGALSDIEKALELNPHYPEALRLQMLLNAILKDRKGDLGDAKKTVELYNGYGYGLFSHYLMGLGLWNLEDAHKDYLQTRKE